MDNRPRILIVDDQADARDMLEALLFREGYVLAFAKSGPEALDQVQKFAPDAILLDVMMPGMDGFEVCRRLRADPVQGEVPVILVTALDDHDSRLRGIEAGADDFVSKPIDRVELRTRVRTITRLNRYRRLLWERSRRLEAEEEILRRNRELTLLNQVITAAASTFDASEILWHACKALANAFELTRVVATLVDEEQSRYTSVLCHQRQGAGCLDGGERANAEPLLSPKSLRQEPLLIGSESADPRLARERDEMRRLGIATVLAVPIIVSDRIAGSFELCSVAGQNFRDHDLTLACSVATAVAQAIDRTRLYHELQYHAQSLEEMVAQRTFELKLERDRTQAILEALGEAVVVTDVYGKVQYMNPAASNLTGYTSDETVGHVWSLWQQEALPEEFRAQMEERTHSDALRLACQKWSGEVVCRRKDGVLYDAAVTVAPVCEPNDAGTIVGFVSVQRDITPIKDAERLKDRFISNVSHELRTPLSVLMLVSGNLDMLFDSLDNDKRRQMIRDIRQHIQVLNGVIDAVLELSRISGGGVSEERDRLNLAQLATEEAEKQLPLAQGKAQTVLISGEKELPVWGNKDQLRQVIRNLLNNAIKYTPQGGQITCECLTCECLTCEQPALDGHVTSSGGQPAYRAAAGIGSGTAEPAGPAPNVQDLTLGAQSRLWAALRVVDTGIGIRPEDLPHLFERFYRVKAEGSIPGTGLGLSIASELIELHGGQLAVASTPGAGSVFTMFLPLLQEDS